jgi:hypothetical protein
MSLSKLFITLSFVVMCIAQSTAQVYKHEPKTHSGKWIDDNEICIQIRDSIAVKLNYREMLGHFLLFEIEVVNLSSTREILVDPNMFVGIWYFDRNFFKVSDDCKKIVFLNRKSSVIQDDVSEEIRAKILRKNTLEPNKSIFGYLILGCCQKDPHIDFTFPISGTAFNFKFTREIEP